MIIYPAIDIKNNKCVRLVQGRFEDATVYSENPVEKALEWERLGARYLHVIDLDGAKSGQIRNTDIMGEIAGRIGIPIQIGGGIRTIETIEMVLGKGVKRVILGTSAVNEPELVKKAIKEFESSIAIAIDARDKMVAIEGWAMTSGFSAVEFAKRVEDLGAKTIIYTDISRDGTLAGPNILAMEEMVNAVGIEVIASGGVKSLQDIRDLKETGVSGAVIGKALYTGDIRLDEAIEIAR